MPNDYYNATGEPQQSSQGSSADMRAELLLVEAGFAKLPTLSGNAGKMVIVNAGETALGVSALTIPASGTLVTLDATQTLTNKRYNWRVVDVADAVSITPNVDNADEVTQTNTQALGTLTINAHVGAPTDAQKLLFRIKSTNAHVLSLNAVYRASTDVPMPGTLSGGGMTDYLGFIYNNADSKWDLVLVAKGYT